MDLNSVLMSLRIKYIEGNSRNYKKSQIDGAYNSWGGQAVELRLFRTEPNVLYF